MSCRKPSCILFSSRAVLHRITKVRSYFGSDFSLLVRLITYFFSHCAETTFCLFFSKLFTNVHRTWDNLSEKKCVSQDRKILSIVCIKQIFIGIYFRFLHNLSTFNACCLLTFTNYWSLFWHLKSEHLKENIEQRKVLGFCVSMLWSRFTFAGVNLPHVNSKGIVILSLLMSSLNPTLCINVCFTCDLLWKCKHMHTNKNNPL